MSIIEDALLEKFEDHRVICWRDERKEMREEFEALQLPGVVKICVRNNEFGTLYRVERGEPNQKFLVYILGPVKDPDKNWVAYLEFAHENFHADRPSLWLAELGLELGRKYSELMSKHPKFFEEKRRRQTLGKMNIRGKSPDEIRLKMLAVLAETDPRLESILEELFAEVAYDENVKYKKIVECKLDVFFWKQIKSAFGYASIQPRVKDFLLRLFDYVHRTALGEPVSNESKFNEEAPIFFKRFKENRRCETVFKKSSELASRTLRLDENIEKHTLDEIGALDTVKEIDSYFLTELVKRISERTLSAAETSELVRRRMNTFWIKWQRDSYLAVEKAAAFLDQLETVKIRIDTPADGFRRYVEKYFTLDQVYRQFVGHVNRAHQPGLFGPLAEKIDRLYANNFLSPLNNLWQEKINSLRPWKIPGVPALADFFADSIAPILDRKKKVFVIISDALRYEIADEIRQQIQTIDRYTAILDAAAAPLPSFTALGMAALLPHKTLELKTSEKDVSLGADGVNSIGTAARAKILAAYVPASTALSAADFLNMSPDQSRTLIRDHAVIYIYHNVIDEIGDDRTTESNVCEKVPQAIDEIIALVKKLMNSNANNVIVTADHGFIYQQNIEESDYLTHEPQGDAIAKINRRFVIGCGLREISGVQKYNAEELGLAGNAEIQIANSIMRLRMKGSGAHYVHGGASLQEIVVPVLKINKKREDDTHRVEIEIISQPQTITTAQFAVKCYQSEPVREKTLPRKIRFGLYSSDDELVSEEKTIDFNLPHSDPRDREFTCSLTLNHNAEKYNMQEIVLRLDELEPGTTVYKVYKTQKYLLRRQLMDLDF